MLTVTRSLILFLPRVSVNVQRAYLLQMFRGIKTVQVQTSAYGPACRTRHHSWKLRCTTCLSKSLWWLLVPCIWEGFRRKLDHPARTSWPVLCCSGPRATSMLAASVLSFRICCSKALAVDLMASTPSCVIRSVGLTWSSSVSEGHS